MQLGPGTAIPAAPFLFPRRSPWVELGGWGKGGLAPLSELKLTPHLWAAFGASLPGVHQDDQL